MVRIVYERWLRRCALAMFAVGALAHSATAQPLGPAISLNPNSGPAGSPVEVRGIDFGPTICAVQILLDSTSGPVLGNAGVDGGAFLTTVTIPSVPPFFIVNSPMSWLRRTSTLRNFRLYS